MHPKDTKACFLDHMGPYAMQDTVLNDLVAGIQADMIVARDRDEEDPAYEVRDGVALIALDGPIMKKRSKFGGASTIDARANIRAALEDSDVHAILVEVNSPGGPIAGVDELHREIVKADKIKPVHGHVTDLGASAGYWAICGARRITANRAAEVGSIGVFAVLQDASEMMKREGVKVIPIASGKLKGAGSFGTKITKEQIEDMQGRVDKAASMFFEAVAQGRWLDEAAMAKIKTGAVFFSEDAKANGLVDEVADLEDVLAKLAKKDAAYSIPGRRTLTLSGQTASLAENLENTVDGDTAILAQSAVLAGEHRSDDMTELEKMKAELEKANQEKADLEAQLKAKAEPAPLTATGVRAPSEDEIEKQVAAEVAKRSLVRARKEAAAGLVEKFGKATGLTDKQAEAFFAGCNSIDHVEGELLIKEAQLKGMSGGNTQVAAENTIKDFHAKASEFDTELEAMKAKMPNDLTGAIRKARMKNPAGYRAYMARCNGGRDVVGAKG